jgi:UDP-N-acetylmuramoyl-L-alanyl-D-glutamate--2,6-diaminopimelate ligase
MNKYSGITDNSKEVISDGLFISYASAKAQEYIDEAIANGAIAVMIPADSDFKIPENIEVIKSKNIMADSTKVAAEYYPKRPAHICAITGTKGKTSIVSFVMQIMKMLGKSAGSIGTLGVMSESFTEEGANTTPRPIQLRKWLENLHDVGVEYLAMEASSHGIDQHRMDCLSFDSVGFSNLLHDHLDYHKTMENYFEAKKKLFTDFEYNVAVINLDDEWGQKLFSQFVIPAKAGIHCQEAELRRSAMGGDDRACLAVGRQGSSIKILNIKPLHDGQEAVLEYFGKTISITTSLIGEFQIYNVLMAIGLVIGMGINKDDLDLPRIFAEMRAPKGRAEYIASKNGAAIFVDYAHMPEALEQTIKAFRRHVSGRLHVLFGCGGDRDNSKRPMMGEIAARLADSIIVTDDNPRTEDATKIRAQIMAACPNALEIGDREQAIKTAMEKLQPGDILIVAGKGHEDYQIIGKEKIHFDDAEVVKKYL